MVEGISIREFARRDGCSDKVVRRKIESGHLQALPDGKLHPALVGTDWRARPSRTSATAAISADTVRVSAPVSADLSAVSARDDETLDEAAERLAPTMLSQFATKADAEKAKETYLALLRKLEYDEKSGEVVKASEVAQIVGAEYAKVRSKLMEIPSSVAPMAVLMKTPEEIRALIEKEVAHALEELAYDGNLGAVS